MSTKQNERCIKLSISKVEISTNGLVYVQFFNEVTKEQTLMLGWNTIEDAVSVLGTVVVDAYTNYFAE